MSFSWTYSRALAAALLIMIVILAKNVVYQSDDLLNANLPNPDSYYKLVLIKDYSPNHGFQYIERDNAPEGSWIHWSIPHTWTILQFHKGLILLGVDSDKALLIAGGGLTLFSMFLLSIFLALAIANFKSPIVTVISGLTLVTSAPLMGYGQLVQITHHIFMLVPLVAAAACIFRVIENAHRGVDLLAGLLLGFALWVSPETMPVVLALSAIRAAIALQIKPAGVVWPMALGLLLMLVLAWLIDPPPPTFSAWALDHISFTWLLFGFFVAIILLCVDLINIRNISIGRAVLILSGLLVLLSMVWLVLVPGALNGPSGLIPTELKAIWWDQIQELKGVSQPSQWIAYLWLPLLGSLLLGYIAWRERSLWMIVLACSALIYGVLSANHIRMGAVATVMSALALCVAASKLSVFSANNKADLSLKQQIFGLFLVVIAPLQVFIVMGLSEIEKGEENKFSCNFQDVVPYLDNMPSGTYLVNINDAPRLLFYTDSNVIAGNYHHNVSGVLDVYKLWRGVDENEVASILSKRKVSHVLGCFPESAAYPEKSLAWYVQSGTSSDLIEVIDFGATDLGWKLYGVGSGDIYKQDI